MKRGVVLLLLVFVGCGSHKDPCVSTEKDTLTVYRLGESEEANLLTSIHIKKNNADFQKIMVNDKEYSPRQFLSILDTLDDSYTFDLKVDSVSKIKILVVTKRE